MTYATVTRVAGIWGPLSGERMAVAENLLAAAERMIVADYPTVPARITAGTLDQELVADIEAAMVKRAMLAADMDGVKQATDVAGPWTQSRTFTNAEQALYLTAAERARLAGQTGGGRVKPGTLFVGHGRWSLPGRRW